MTSHQILTFYHFTSIQDPEAEVKKHHDFLKNLDVRCRVYIARDGINAQMSFSEKDMQKYIQWLRSDSRFKDIMIRIDPYHEHVFPKTTIKIREELVALGCKTKRQKTAEHISPQKWKEMLDKRDDKTILIDVRNNYESAIGHFEGALRPNLKTFREFPEVIKQLKKEKDQKIMMYCTGGIRCEVYSPLLNELGFDKIYQLDGGIINYGHLVGNAHWRGKLFVFDDRLSVTISQDEHQIISPCHFCDAPSDVYYNCGNMDCNELFLSCLSCAEKLLGCCSKKCTKAPRRRVYDDFTRPKPFRKGVH